MRRRAEHFELTLVVAIAGLTFLFQTIFGSLFYSALLKFLEKHFGILESEVLAKFSEIFVPLCLSILVTAGIYQFVHRNLRREFESDQPQLRLVYAADKTIRHSNGVRQTYLYARNEGENDVSGAQVKIEEAKVKKDGSDTWGPTDIVARTNMSWGDKPDRHSDKYGEFS